MYDDIYVMSVLCVYANFVYDCVLFANCLDVNIHVCVYPRRHLRSKVGDGGIFLFLYFLSSWAHSVVSIHFNMIDL